MKKCFKVFLCVIMAFGLFAVSANAAEADGEKVQVGLVVFQPDAFGSLALDVYAENNTYEPISGKLILAKYDENGKMSGIFSGDFSLDAREHSILPRITLPYSYPIVFSGYKLFIWDSLGGLVPLTVSEQVEYVRETEYRRAILIKGVNDYEEFYGIVAFQAGKEVQTEIPKEDGRVLNLENGDVVFVATDANGNLESLDLLFRAKDAAVEKNADNGLWQRAYDIYHDDNPDNDDEVTEVFGFVARRYNGSFCLTENYVSSFSDDIPHLVVQASRYGVHIYEVDPAKTTKNVRLISFLETIVNLKEGEVGSYAYIRLHDGDVTDVIVYTMVNE